MIKISLAVLAGIIAGYFSIRVVSLSDNESTATELNSYRWLGMLEGQAICSKRR